eukprot:gene9535-6692_t
MKSSSLSLSPPPLTLMVMDLASLFLVSALRKFFSLIIGVMMAILTLVYLIAAAHYINVQKNFGKLGFAYFLAILSALVTVVGYIVLHVVPRKAYRLLYALTGLFLLSGFLLGQAMGLSGPTVNDCRLLGSLDLKDAITSSMWEFGKVGWVVNNSTAAGATAIGSLGQPVTNCSDHVVIFVSSFLLLILYVIGLFDVQKVLLTRVKSKTYGERFVEMGISN